jgi:hypothetical protein
MVEQIHRRLLVQEMDVGVARRQSIKAAGPHADDRDGDAVQPRQQALGKVGAGNHGWPNQAEPIRAQSDEL